MTAFRDALAAREWSSNLRNLIFQLEIKGTGTQTIYTLAIWGSI